MLERITQRLDRGHIKRQNQPNKSVVIATILASMIAMTAPINVAEARPKKKAQWDVSYLWHSDIEAVLDHQEEVGDYLGPQLAKKLKVVKGRSGNFGLIYDRNGTKDQATRTAKTHAEKLRKRGLGSATRIKDEGYNTLYNVVYGRGLNLDALKRDFKKIYSQLGSNVGKDLLIEKIKTLVTCCNILS